ncbi:MAG: lipid-binding SYLF domain-containing protein [Cyanobacteria bacterium P01_F01_bin.42]
MNRNPLLLSLLILGGVFGGAGIAVMPLRAQGADASDEMIESTAPGSTYEGIPNVEPAPEFEPKAPIAAPDVDATAVESEALEVEAQPEVSAVEAQPEVSAADPLVLPDKDSLNKSERKVVKAIRTFEEFVSDPDIDIPADLLRQSEGIIIIPNMVQAGFFFGGRRGTGVLSLRNDDGTWSNPAFVKMTGGSIGLQIGAKSSDLVLIFPKRDMVHEAFSGSYKLGGNISGTAGNIGSSPVDSTREYSKEKIYAYSRSSGFYGGVSLEGSELSFSSKRNREFYGQVLSPRQIFANIYTEIPPVADSLSTLLSQAESGEFELF